MNRLETYSAYLLGEHWKKLKSSIYRERGRKCEACGSRQFIQGHHLIYRDPLESCTASDIMLLCPRCHGYIHEDAVLDRFLKSKSETTSAVRRRMVMAEIARRWGGAKSLSDQREHMERSYAGERAKVDAIQPLREVRRPWKRWKDYSPDKIIPKHLAWMKENT